MFIFTERHGDGLLSHRDGATGSSRLGFAGGIGTPNPDYIPVTGLSSKGIASTGAAPICDSAWHTKSHAINALLLRELPQHAASVTESYRAQRLDEMLASIHEYAAASPAFRPYWRKLAMHDIARFKRDYLQPERAAFEAAVARQQSRRAA